MAGTTRPHRAITLTAGGVPRIVEPLFTVFGDGDSSGGSTSGRDWQDDDLMLQQYQMPVGGKIVSIMPWIRSGTGLLRVAAYDSGAGEPGDLLAFAEFNVVTPPDDFLEVPLSEPDYIDVLEDDFLWLGRAGRRQQGIPDCGHACCDRPAHRERAVRLGPARPGTVYGRLCGQSPA